MTMLRRVTKMKKCTLWQLITMKTFYGSRDGQSCPTSITAGAVTARGGWPMQLECLTNSPLITGLDHAW
jgi:hypothetical protein